MAMGNEIVDMLLVCFGKTDDDWKGDVILRRTPLGFFQELFAVKENDAMYYECYFVGSKEKEQLEQKFGLVLETELYDYFVEFYAE